jgi:hypothetical protein
MEDVPEEEEEASDDAVDSPEGNTVVSEPPKSGPASKRSLRPRGNRISNSPTMPKNSLNAVFSYTRGQANEVDESEDSEEESEYVEPGPKKATRKRKAAPEKTTSRKKLRLQALEADQDVDSEDGEHDNDQESAESSDADPNVAVESDADPTHRPGADGLSYHDIQPFDDTSAWESKLQAMWQIKRGNNPSQENKIPAGYRLYRSSRAGRSTHKDFFLFGHPKWHRFRSPNEFFRHLVFLVDKSAGRNSGNAETECGCPYCRARNLKPGK